jgi:cobalamin biosynthesis Co2+ chelatase CbiK
MNSCPCCSTSMFRQVRYQKIYWFCPSCYQEMPNLIEILADNARQRVNLVAPRTLVKI